MFIKCVPHSVSISGQQGKEEKYPNYLFCFVFCFVVVVVVVFFTAKLIKCPKQNLLCASNHTF